MFNKIPEMHQLSLLMIIKNVTQTLHDTHYEWFVRNSSYVCLVQVLWKPPCCWLQASETAGLSTAITETFMVVSGEYTCFDHGSSCTFTLVWMWTEASCHACCCSLECVCLLAAAAAGFTLLCTLACSLHD